MEHVDIFVPGEELGLSREFILAPLPAFLIGRGYFPSLAAGVEVSCPISHPVSDVFFCDAWPWYRYPDLVDSSGGETTSCIAVHQGGVLRAAPLPVVSKD